MADHAGQVLVGLTLRPGRPGTNDLLVYLLPLEGEKAAGALSGHVILNKSSQPLSKCGDTCRTASVIVRGHQELSVRVDGPKGGVATFKLPDLPAPDGSALLQQAQARIHQLRTYRLFETLSSGIATIASRYSFQAPNRMESVVNDSRTVWVADTRYTRASRRSLEGGERRSLDPGPHLHLGLLQALRRSQDRGHGAGRRTAGLSRVVLRRPAPRHCHLVQVVGRSPGSGATRAHAGDRPFHERPLLRLRRAAADPGSGRMTGRQAMAANRGGRRQR